MYNVLYAIKKFVTRIYIIFDGLEMTCMEFTKKKKTNCQLIVRMWTWIPLNHKFWSFMLWMFSVFQAKQFYLVYFEFMVKQDSTLFYIA